jgi:endonuclease/exonuclease/phosphatase (EEP) superfamily protein YafD
MAPARANFGAASIGTVGPQPDLTMPRKAALSCRVRRRGVRFGLCAMHLPHRERGAPGRHSNGRTPPDRPPPKTYGSGVFHERPGALKVPRRRKGPPHWIDRWRNDRIGIAMLLIITGIWAWILIWLTTGDTLRFFGYVNALGFFWGLAAAAAAIVLLLRRSFIPAAIGATAALIALSHGQLPEVSGYFPGAPAQVRPIRVVTASLRTLNQDMTSAAQTLAVYKPDILVAQEVSDLPAFMHILDATTKANWNVANRGNEIVASRWPVSSPDPTSDFLRAEVAAPGGPITVWNIHAAKSYSGVIPIRLQFAEFLDDIRTHGSAKIVAGDFNATPWNESYASMAGLLTDAYAVAGWGPGFTFPTRARRLGAAFPYLRIDHVFVDPSLHPVGAFVGQASAGADHRPVVVDLLRIGAK